MCVTPVWFFMFCPVPVRKVHVSVGERVELPCDVTTSVANWDEPLDAARSSPYPYDILRDSSRKANGRLASERSYSSSSSGRNRIRHHNYGTDWRDHDYAANNRGDNDQEEEEKDEEGAYLVLWFIDPDRKPIYRFPFFFPSVSANE